MENIRNIIESLLFVSDTPLTVDKLKSVLETVDPKEIRANLNALADQYEARGGSFRLCEVAGGWQLRTRPEYHEYIKRLLQPPPQRLSRAALETLAIVAYNQPIIRADIEHIRGVDCGAMLRQLLERKLIRVLGRKEIPGRPLIYATAKLFLELFELRNLKDLPTPKEIEEMGAAANDHAFATPSDTTTKSGELTMPFSPPEQNLDLPTGMAPNSTPCNSECKIAKPVKTVGRPVVTAVGKTPIGAAPHKIPVTLPGIGSTISDVPVKNTDHSRQIFSAAGSPMTRKKTENACAARLTDNSKKP